MILISTAGKVDSGAAHVLAQRGQPVRVLVRRPEKKASADSPIPRRRGQAEIDANAFR